MKELQQRMNETLPAEAISGQLLHRAWVKSGRPDPLLDDDAWDGFALTVQAVARLEGLVRETGLRVAQTRLSEAGLHDGRCPEPDLPCNCGLDAAIFAWPT